MDKFKEWVPMVTVIGTIVAVGMVLRVDLNDVRGDLDIVRTDVRDLRTTMGNVREDVAKLHEKAGAVSDNVQALGGKVEALGEKVNSLGERLATVETQIDQMERVAWATVDSDQLLDLLMEAEPEELQSLAKALAEAGQ